MMGSAARRAAITYMLATASVTVPAMAAERLVASLSSDTVRIASDFTGVELVLFGAIEGGPSAAPGIREEADGGYDIVATVTGPRQSLVTRRKERIFGIWVNADSRSFIDVPSYLAVLSSHPFATIADADTLRRERIGIARTPLPQHIGPDIAEVVPTDPFRQAFVRLKRERGFYMESTDAVTFLTPSLYRAPIKVPAEAQTGRYNVNVKLFSGGAVVSSADVSFEIVTVGFESFMAGAAVNYGLLYGLATAMMALVTGWLASIVFRRD